MQLFTIIEFFFFIFIAYKILKERSQEKTFYIYVYGCLVLYPATHLISGIPHPTVVLPIMCVIRAWMDGRIKEEWKEFPLKTLLAIMVVYHFFHPLLASLMSYSESLKLELFELSQTFIVLFGGYLLAPVVFDEDKLKRHIYIISVILIVTGILCWVSKSNFISAAFSSTGDSYYSSDAVETERGFRATGTQFSPNVYGNALVLCVLLIYHYFKNAVLKYVAIGFLLLCIVFTASRAPFFVLIVGFFLYSFFQRISKLIGSVLVVMLVVILFGGQLKNNEYIGRYVGGITDLVLTGGEYTAGSSSDLRERQWLITLFYWKEAPVWGHGEGYTMQLVNETGLFNNLKNDDLAGAEGYQYITLIDYGITYTLIALLFFVWLLCYFYKFLKYDITKESAILGLTFTICLFVFLLSSRPNQIWQIYFPFVGLYLKNIVHKNRIYNF